MADRYRDELGFNNIDDILEDWRSGDLSFEEGDD